jgi:carbohydrate kinase (thermoresistant glucokinase family)
MPPAPLHAIVVMGVSGVGKTTVAEVLARRLGWGFIDGDAFHPPSNVAKMRSGTPLTDEDRWPWFERLGAEIDRRRSAAERVVLACSALKRAYRKALIGGHRDVCLVYLQGSRDLIMSRLSERKGHYFPPHLLDSQLATLEEPDASERALIVGVENGIDDVVTEIIGKLDRQEAG